MAYRWSEAQNRLLIRLVKERPCLWNKSDPERSNKQARDANWEEIDTMLGTLGANRRFKSLRDDYTRWTKGTRKEYNYADDMSFLQDEIGHRNGAITKRKERLLLDTTIEVLDESDESQGLCDEQQSSSNVSLQLNPSQMFPYHQMASYFQPPAVDEYQLENPQTSATTITTAPGSSSSSLGLSSRSKRPRIETKKPDAPSPNPELAYWQAPVDETNISREDFEYCKAIIGAMSPLPTSMRRKLKAQIYHLITETVNKYEDGIL